MFKSILVLESTWDSGSLDQKSVWPFVSEFAKASDIQAFHKHFTNKKSFEHWIDCYNRENIPGEKLLYIASHGEKGQIEGLNIKIKKSTIKEILSDQKNIKYLHFGTCFFAKNDNFDELLNEIDHLKWIAGYTKEVDWIDSTLFDILVWRRMTTKRDEENKGIHQHTLIDQLVNEDVSGLAGILGFSLKSRHGNRIKSI